MGPLSGQMQPAGADQLNPVPDAPPMAGDDVNGKGPRLNATAIK